MRKSSHREVFYGLQKNGKKQLTDALAFGPSAGVPCPGYRYLRRFEAWGFLGEVHYGHVLLGKYLRG